MLDQPVDAVNDFKREDRGGQGRGEATELRQSNDFYEKHPQIIIPPETYHQKSFNAKTTHFSNNINNHQSDNISEHCFV